ncbi:UDP-galactose transporter [Malassezia caprae]|uniref:UDP-galactose transporter homolog 1 n=1 Tax=Malassezia caprae TaxID=1381934 RepID=A0AAF0E8I8_9BASI|nr:UDP-galactose transporter [Malassezia caprae]
MSSQQGLVPLLTCALAIYTMFLVWGLLQEKITSTTYRTGDDPLDPFSVGERFEYGIMLNALQALCSCTSASLYLLYRTRRAAPPAGQPRSLLQRLGLDVLTPSGCERALVARGRLPAGKRLKGLSRYISPLLQQYLLVSALQSTTSWLSIVTLRHLSFPAITLAKSSKLVPVLLMNVLLYRRQFAAYKYVVVALVTLGVWMFMALGKRKGAATPHGNSTLGMSLLAIHLLIDGATNSTQDEVFATYASHVSGTQMMLVMNAISATYMTTALLVPKGLVQFLVVRARHFVASLLHPHWMAAMLLAGIRTPELSWTPQLVSGFQFLVRHPDAARDVLGYALAGALGQIAIFETLERFGSLTLVSITVTRKLFTMLLSILVYKHQLRSLQWVGVVVVFAGLFIEMRQKQRQQRAAAKNKSK